MNSIFPTAYLPSVRYMSLFINSDSPVIEIYETYQKQSCRTRCRVMTANGIQTLTVPVVKPDGNHTLTKDILISYKESWQQVHLRCLESAYRKSAYFDYYYPHIEKIYKNKFDTLIEMNEFCLNTIFKILKTKKDFSYSEDFAKINGENDYRISLSKEENHNIIIPEYYQVFADRHNFVHNMSVIDLIFNEGPYALEYLSNLKPDMLS